MARIAPLLLIVLLVGCQPEEPPYNPYTHGGSAECGRINAVDLVGLREQEAARYARYGGCELRVVTRDHRQVARPAWPDPDLPATVVNVTIRDGYVHRLGR